MGCLGMIAWMAGITLVIIGSDLGHVYILLGGVILAVVGGLSMHYGMKPKQKKPGDY